MQQHIIGCWKHDFDKILLTNCKNKSLIWIYRWTLWGSRWQPTRFGHVGWLPSNHTGVESASLLTSRAANVLTVQYGPVPGTIANTSFQTLSHASVATLTSCIWPYHYTYIIELFQIISVNPVQSLNTPVMALIDSPLLSTGTEPAHLILATPNAIYNPALQ